jgi:hypothetical protein
VVQAGFSFFSKFKLIIMFNIDKFNLLKVYFFPFSSVRSGVFLPFLEVGGGGTLDAPCEVFLPVGLFDLGDLARGDLARSDLGDFVRGEVFPFS